jgi:hypothetical protein
MIDLSQRCFCPTPGQESPTYGVDRTAVATKDAGRVIIGGACGGVKANNEDKVRRC